MFQTKQTKIYPTLSDYVGCLKNEVQTRHELVRESTDVEQEKQKPTITVEQSDHNMK